MSCPRWDEALAWRFTAAGEEPEDWAGLTAHLETCPACRRRATAVDPTLALRRGRRIEVEDAEVAAIVDASRSWIRLRALEAAGGAARTGRAARYVAGLAAAVVVAILIAPGISREPDAPAPAGAELSSVAGRERASEPWIENLDRPEARVYQWGSDDLDVVMVVDGSLDV